MANPFLMADEELSPQSNDLNSNPFLMEANDDEDAGDNPFLAQGVSNPFSDFGNDGGVPDTVATTLASEMAGFPVAIDSQPNMFMESATTEKKPENIDSAMSFFGTTITDQDELEESHGLPKPTAIHIQKDMLTNFDDKMMDSDDELLEPHPPARPVPPSRTTQDLILSVSDQLDQTSSHLLDRIPVTRTPSPVSMRDLHSPSPTPDSMDNLLDISDEVNENTAFVSNDNPFAMNDEPEVAPVKAEPPRPPPPRPIPPRPTPPRRPSPPQVAVPAPTPTPQRPPPRPAPPQAEPADLFDMFGSDDLPAQPKQAPAPKSNQDILSLFSVAPAAAAAPAVPDTDLLSGDILTSDFNPSPPMVQQSPQQVPETTSNEPFIITANEEKTTAESSDTEAIDYNVSSTSPIVSDIHTSPPAEKENILDDDSVLSPDQSAVYSVTPVSFDHATVTVAPPSISDEQMDTTVDFGAATPSPSINPFSSPEEDRDVVAPVPMIIADEVLSFAPAAPKADDAFDAFAAKFDSVKKEDSTNLLDGFGPPSRSVSAEFGNKLFSLL